MARWRSQLDEGHVSFYGLVHFSVHFELRGQSYELVTDAPITSAETIWIRNDTDFKPTRDMMDASDDKSFIGSLKLDSDLAKPR